MLFSVGVIDENGYSRSGFLASERALVKVQAIEMHCCSGIGRPAHKISDRFDDHRKCVLRVRYTSAVDRRRILVDPQLESSNHYCLLSVPYCSYFLNLSPGGDWVRTPSLGVPRYAQVQYPSPEPTCKAAAATSKCPKEIRFFRCPDNFSVGLHNLCIKHVVWVRCEAVLGREPANPPCKY